MVSGLQMDYRRFQSQAQLACYTNERDAIREYDATTPITTNLMGTFKDLDYFEWAKEMDVVSWDNYPGMDTPPSFTAMCHDLMRGIGGNKPFMLMEQTPNQQNWFPFCKVKQPGEVRKLMKQNAGVSNIEITKDNIKAFESTAKKYGIDFALKKDSTEIPPRYLVFFKGRDADALTAAFKEFSAKKLTQEQKPSIFLAFLILCAVPF